MAWLKVDDKMHAHRKTRRALSSHPTKRRDSAAMGLWLMAGAWTSQNNFTIGWVPEYELESWDDDWQELAKRLVTAGYWWPEQSDGEPGFGFVNWAEWNPSTDAAKSGTFGNHVRWHSNRGVVELGCEHCPTEPDVAPDDQTVSGRIAPDVAPESGGESDRNRETSLYPTPTRPLPDPTRPENSSPTIADATETEETREDVEALCQHLAARIIDNGNKPPAISKAWRAQARLLVDRDARDPGEAHRLIDWCQNDTFWMTNILSMPKFREQYDKLRLRAGNDAGMGTSRATADYSGYGILDEHGQYREPPRPSEAMMTRRPDPYEDLAG